LHPYTASKVQACSKVEIFRFHATGVLKLFVIFCDFSEAKRNVSHKETGRQGDDYIHLAQGPVEGFATLSVSGPRSVAVIGRER
jgi:hypothetical protein